MIHWLFLIYWICKYAYTGEFNDMSLGRNFLIFILGVLENGIWVGVCEALRKFRGEK